MTPPTMSVAVLMLMDDHGVPVSLKSVYSQNFGETSSLVAKRQQTQAARAELSWKNLSDGFSGLPWQLFTFCYKI